VEVEETESFKCMKQSAIRGHVEIRRTNGGLKRVKRKASVSVDVDDLEVDVMM